MDVKIFYEYTKSIRVLFVEDDVSVRESMSTLLAFYFLELVSAVDGVDALKKIDSSTNKFDLIISDINMPNMDGIEMAKKVLLDNPDMHIIFISAYNDAQYLQKAIDIGVSGFLSKPLKQEALHKAIYKVAQIISDNKFVLSHMDMIEELNMQLENKNEELKKSLRLLETMCSKEKILQTSQEKNVMLEKKEVVDDATFETQIQQLVNEDLQELRELHMEIDRCIISIINSDANILEDFEIILEKFNKYVSLLTYHTFFTNLSAAMKDFALILKDNPIPTSLEKRENVFMLLETFLYVLKKWQNELELGNKEMINFFDASIINDMTTISNMWLNSSTQEKSFGEMEFF